VGLELVEEMPSEWRRDGVDLKYVRMYAIDAKGRRVPDACNMLNVTVEGPAELYALDNGDHFTGELFNVSAKAMKGGFMLAILKSKTGTGKVTLKIKGAGIEPAFRILSR
jgi:beta-galactosidase